MKIYAEKHNSLTRTVAVAVKTVTICVISLALACVFLGCSASAVNVGFTRESITLYVGESRDVAPYVVFDPIINDSRDNLKISTDGDCVEVGGTVITAVKAGVATVRATTASGGRDGVMTVTVIAREEQDMYLEVDGQLLQALSDGQKPSALTFSARFEDTVLPNGIEWRVNGKTVQTGASSTLEFAPVGIGEYTVAAQAGDLLAEHIVKVYRKTQTSVEYTGNLIQPDGNFSAVTFYAREIMDAANPATVYEWRVNGVVSGALGVFEFTPQAAGEYKITLAVNGVTQTVAGGDGIVVEATGDRAPLGRVTFDDADGVYIDWADGEHIVRVTIVSPDGRRRDIERSDAAHAYRFSRGRFNADGLIEPFAENPAEYAITLVAEGKREFKFTQYPEAARRYADEKVLCRNSFISSEADGTMYIAELYAVGASRERCYIDGDANKITSAMRAAASDLGMSAYIVADGHIATVELDGIVNAPSKFDAGKAERVYAVMPHIEYDQTARRPSNYVFALDRVKKSAEVESSEQLLLATACGIRPAPVKKSTAEVIYGSARNRLVSIIGADYTAEQKVHAVYDWLQWVIVRAETPSATGSGRFLESVFGSAELTVPSGGLRRAAVTSEGAAKAFALMARIEGIDCVIESSATADGGRRFWNKVKLDGRWYNVDVFGGKIPSDEIGLSSARELTSHRGLLTDDAYMIKQGLTPQGGALAAYDASKSAYLKKHVADGAYFDYYAGDYEIADESMYDAAVAYAFGACAIGSVSVPVYGGIETYINNTLGAEFALADDVTDSEIATVIARIRAAADKYAEKVYGQKFASNAVAIYRTGSTVTVAATAPRRG